MENNKPKEVKNGRIIEFTDPLTEMKYEYNEDTKELTNTTLTPKQVVEFQKWERKYDYNPTTIYEMKDANNKQINFFKTTHPITGEIRLCMRNKDKSYDVWFTIPILKKFIEKVVEKEFIPPKPTIEITNKEEWLITIIEEKYGFRLLRRILSRKTKITSTQFSEMFDTGLMTAIKHLNKFEKLGLFKSRRDNHGKKVYRTWLKPEELKELLKNVM